MIIYKCILHEGAILPISINESGLMWIELEKDSGERVRIEWTNEEVTVSVENQLVVEPQANNSIVVRGRKFVSK